MKKAAILAAGLVLSAVAALAGDLTITYKAHSRAGSGTEVHYYSANFFRTNHESTKTDQLFDVEKGVFYTIKHKDRKVEKMTIDDLVAAGEAMKQQMPEGMEGMMAGMFGDPNDFKVEPAGSETVIGRPCKKFVMTIGKLHEELSVDPTLKPPMNPEAYRKLQKALGSMAPGGGPMAKMMKRLQEETAKLQGMALKTHVTGLMGMDVTTEATDVKTTPIPAATFELPAGYAVEDAGKKMREEMQKGGRRRS